VIPIALTLIVHPLLPLLPKIVTDNVAFAFPPPPSFPALQANIGFSLLAFVGAIWAVPFVSEAFAAKGLKGRDQCKPGGRTGGPWM
jgi:UDP-N-acetylglucosamine--dolichyl-phosphate N-acetylglucosaminephosphotransferase